VITIPRAKAPEILDLLGHPLLLYLTIIELPFSFKIIQALEDGTAPIHVVDKERDERERQV
jgi:hypothetical protein